MRKGGVEGGVARSLRQPAASSGFDPVAPESSKKELRSPAVWRVGGVCERAFCDTRGFHATVR